MEGSVSSIAGGTSEITGSWEGERGRTPVVREVSEMAWVGSAMEREVSETAFRVRPEGAAGGMGRLLAESDM